MSPAVVTRALRYTYPGAAGPAVRSIDMEVADGEIFGFLGPSGAGKTTTVNILIGLVDGWSGTVELLGRPMHAWGDELYDRIGVGFELPVGYPALTAREDLTHFSALHARSPRDIDELLDAVGLAEAADTRLGDFSKGMRIRLNLARALVHRPDVLFLDEPTSGLDPVTTDRVRTLIRAERERGATVFLTTHDMVTADAICDRVAFVVDGSIVACDSPRALRLAGATGAVRVERRTNGRVDVETVPLSDHGRIAELVASGTVERLTTVEPDLAEVFATVVAHRDRS